MLSSQSLYLNQMQKEEEGSDSEVAEVSVPDLKRLATSRSTEAASRLESKEGCMYEMLLQRASQEVSTKL